MKYFVLSIGYLAILNFVSAKDKPENSQLSMDRLVRKYGYPFEVHGDLHTEDGYILELHRIPHGKDNVTVGKKPVALLMHGLYGTSRNFVAFGPERGLAFHLADRGYDVWLGNTRGTRPCRKHLRLNPNTDRKFWDFSWHEIGIYDLPAIVDYVLAFTHEERINYIGHSQGCTSFFIWTSTRPEYNSRIKVMIGMAPAVFMDRSTQPLHAFGQRNVQFLTRMLKQFGIDELPPLILLDVAIEVTEKNCFIGSPFERICANILPIAELYNPPHITMKDLPELFRDMPSVATRQLAHYAQLIKTGTFRQYDFGPMENFRRYGSAVPPSYNLSKTVAPVAVYYSETDKESSYRDVEYLCDVLPNCFYRYKVHGFGHLSFAFGKDIVKFVYEDVFSTLSKYN